MNERLKNLVIYFDEFWREDKLELASMVCRDIYQELIECDVLPDEMISPKELGQTVEDKFDVLMGKNLLVIISKIAAVDCEVEDEEENEVKYGATTSAIVIHGNEIICGTRGEKMEHTTDNETELIVQIVEASETSARLCPDNMDIELLPIINREDILTFADDIGLLGLEDFLDEKGRKFVIIATFINGVLSGMVINTIYEVVGGEIR